MISIAVAVIRTTLTQINSDRAEYSFATSIPGLEEIIQIFIYLETVVDHCSEILFTGGGQRMDLINVSFTQIKREIKSLFRVLYVKLIWTWKDEMSACINLYKGKHKNTTFYREDEHTVIDLLCRYHLAVGVYLLFNMRTYFKQHNQLIKNKIYETIESDRQPERRLLFKQFLDTWLDKDKDANNLFTEPTFIEFITLK